MHLCSIRPAAAEFGNLLFNAALMIWDDPLMGIYFDEMVRRDGADFVPTAIKRCQVLLDAIAPYSAETEAGRLGMTASLDGGFRETVNPVLENCPGLNVVLAHPGAPWGDDCAKKRFQWVSEYENLYMDISGTGLYRWNMLRYGVNVCGPEKNRVRF